MTTDEWLRLLPLVGIWLVLGCFGTAALVRVWRRGRRGWPLSWECLSAMMLLGLSCTAGASALLIATDYRDRSEHRVINLILWGTLGLSLWAFRVWLGSEDDR